MKWQPVASSSEAYDIIRSRLDQLLALAKSDRPEFFSRAAISEDDVRSFILQRMNAMRLKMTEPAPTYQAIPKIIHRLWLTSPSHASLPPALYLAQISSQSRTLQARNLKYQYIFWTNSAEICETLQKTFDAEEAPITVRNISGDFVSNSLMPVIVLFLDSKKYALAADVAKTMILSVFGGVYGDLGVQFSPDLLPLIHAADAAVFLDKGLFFQLALLAVRPGSEILGVWNSLLLHPEILTSIVLPKVEEFTPGQEVWMHCGVAFSVIFLLFQPKDFYVLVMPPQSSMMQTMSEGSWYREGTKFGNVAIRDSSVTRLSIDRHKTLVKQLAQDQTPNANEVRAKLLSKTKDIFFL